MRRPLAAGAVLAVLLAFPAVVARAGGAPRTHDGFFLRVAPGIGGSRIRVEHGPDHIEYSGNSGDLDIAIGGMIRPNLALHGTLFGWTLSNPDYDIALSAIGSGRGSTRGTAAMSAIGGGATWYLMPANFYLSGSLGAGRFRFDPENGARYESDNGLALELSLGKEWWVGNSWGLGLAGSYQHGSLPDPDIDENWNAGAYAVRFSATFN